MRVAVHALLVLATLLALPACPKGETSTSGEQEPVVEAPKSRFSGATKVFVDSLVATPARIWTVDDAGAAVVYDELSFSEDGTWSARTTVRFGGESEPFDCTESGTWTLDGDQAESKTVGGINFELNATDCAGREAPQSFRAHVTSTGGESTLEHR